MYIIRFQRFPKGVSLKYKIIVIKRGSSPNSQAFVDLIGYYNKDSNLLKLKMDAFYK